MPRASFGAAAKPALRLALQRLGAHLPVPGSRGAGPSARLYCVYRSVNAPHVLALLGSLGPRVVPALHSLDRTPPELARWTRSAGSGLRMPLLQSLLEAEPPGPDDFVLLADDDVTFVRRGPSPFLALVTAAGFDIAQPAHAPGSNGSFENLEVKALTTARRVGFVEVGPLVALSPRAQRVVLPFPIDAQMGWGIDVEWAVAAGRSDLSMGVVDATQIMHHGKVGAAYSSGAEELLLSRRLTDLGVDSPHELSVTFPPRWRPWQRSAPWRGAPVASAPRPS